MDTIFALSSGALPSAVAVIRCSGPASASVLRQICGEVAPWKPALRVFRDEAGEIIDRGIALAFAAPRSFTGEECCEFHVHGGRAVVQAMLRLLSRHGMRMAEPGEFARRAFANGKLDLTEVEGLADLISAETELQRRQALDQVSGRLRGKAEQWRDQLVRMRASVEAALDFSDEHDVGPEVAADVDQGLSELLGELQVAIAGSAGGERIREGFRVVITGPPNAGKSSLFNALAGREAAIVTADAGTTRDVIEIMLDLDGMPVILSDTAGLREAGSPAEQEGIRRARAAAGSADLVVCLDESRVNPLRSSGSYGGDGIDVATKSDLHGTATDGRLSISAATGAGLGELMQMISARAHRNVAVHGALITRERQATSVREAAALLAEAREGAGEIRAELLRRAGDKLGQLGGGVGVEDVLDALFAEFCIGK